MAPADPVVSTSAGRVRGRIEKGIAVFRGIPFAEPPIGPLRFQAPEPPAPWDGVREATEFGPAAPQAQMMAEAGRPAPVRRHHRRLAHGQRLDPRPRRRPGCRSLVWIYGGAYMFGASSEPGYDGTPFARGGAVFVSLNYRLGMEGFAQLPGAPANRGLLDAVAALTWVKENIEGFGGDPANVTVFGESAGAGVIAAMLAMDKAKGLFKRAIAQSVPGSFFTRELATDIAQAIARAGRPALYLPGAGRRRPDGPGQRADGRHRPDEGVPPVGRGQPHHHPVLAGHRRRGAAPLALAGAAGGRGQRGGAAHRPQPGRVPALPGDGGQARHRHRGRGGGDAGHVRPRPRRRRRLPEGVPRRRPERHVRADLLRLAVPDADPAPGPGARGLRRPDVPLRTRGRRRRRPVRRLPRARRAARLRRDGDRA